MDGFAPTAGRILRVLLRMQLCLPRDARYVVLMRNVTDCILADLQVPQEARSDMEVAISEACANAVKHANTVNEYQVRIGIGSDHVEVEIADLGPGFEPPELTDDGDPDTDMESGRGLYLIQALVDDLQFIRTEDENKVRLIKTWPELSLQPAGEPAVR
jgi:serine/threonine-protein kinase RsbW